MLAKAYCGFTWSFKCITGALLGPYCALLGLYWGSIGTLLGPYWGPIVPSWGVPVLGDLWPTPSRTDPHMAHSSSFEATLGPREPHWSHNGPQEEEKKGHLKYHTSNMQSKSKTTVNYSMADTTLLP